MKFHSVLECVATILFLMWLCAGCPTQIRIDRSGQTTRVGCDK